MPLLNPIARFPQDPPDDAQYEYQWNFKAINAEAGWAVTLGHRSIRVAVIDEGCDFNHPDLTRALLTKEGVTLEDGVKVRGDGDAMQPYPALSHGTECAGIIAAETNNQQCVAGLAPDCTILPIRLISKEPIDLANAIKHAIERRARVISISLASPSYSFS